MKLSGSQSVSGRVSQSAGKVCFINIALLLRHHSVNEPTKVSSAQCFTEYVSTTKLS